MKTIRISAKCGEQFSAVLEQNGNQIGEYDGNVPDFFPGKHYGDYIELEIDVTTGHILNWYVPTKEDLKIFK